MDDGLELWLTLDTFSNCFKLYQTGTVNVQTEAILETAGHVDTYGAIAMANVTITNVEYVANYVELNPVASQSIAGHKEIERAPAQSTLNLTSKS